MPSTTLHVLLTAAALALGAAALPSSAAAQGTPRDETSKGYAFIEVVLPERSPFVGEPFTLRLRAGVDVDVLEANLVQLFRQPLDVPVQLDHPWFEGGAALPPGAAPASASSPLALAPARAAGGAHVEASADAPGSVTGDVARVALGADLATAARHVERGAEARRFTVLELERTFVADAPGVLNVPEARLGFAYAVEFREDLVAGRVALDRHDAFVRAGAKELTVRALPETGRPFSFTGAVGRFTLAAELTPERIPLDATALLTVTLTAESLHAAAVERFTGPRLDRFDGFDVVASREATAGLVRTFEVELAPTRAGTLPVGPIEFASFDPSAERYVELATPRLDVHVGTPPAVEPGPSGKRALTARGAGAAPVDDGLGFDVALPALLQFAAGIVVVALALVLITAMRRRR
jgi:hypothetical protein